jgi:hypothetical protein
MGRHFDAAWTRVREEYLKRHCCCIKCAEMGLQVAATAVGDIKPCGGANRSLLWDRRNWQSLCEMQRAAGTEGDAASSPAPDDLRPQGRRMGLVTRMATRR